MVLVEMVRKKMRRERMHPSKEEGLMVAGNKFYYLELEETAGRSCGEHVVRVQNISR